MNKQHIEQTMRSLTGLTCYRGIRRDPVIMKLEKYLRIVLEEKSETELADACFDFVSELVEKSEALGLKGNVFREYLCHLCVSDVNDFSLSVERRLDYEGKTLHKLAYEDMERIISLMSLDIKNILEALGCKVNLTDYEPCMPLGDDGLHKVERSETARELMDALICRYSRFGCGDFARYPMYKYEEGSGITAVLNYDRVLFSELIGYEAQKKALISNTEAFLNGHEANNVLLAGARGTGKSSCVKALANEFFEKGLRLIEISKEQLVFMPCILKELEKRGRYFIIFIDDLSFEEFETQYKYMKSLLEGGVEARPGNVLFYATSNRRHIVKEKWSDKADAAGDEEELHSSDTINEKLSLSDRFGLTITFPKPNPDQYLDIVTGLVKQKDIEVEPEALKKRALQWELSQKGRSGRTARQFVSHLLWELRKK